MAKEKSKMIYEKPRLVGLDDVVPAVGGCKAGSGDSDCRPGNSASRCRDGSAAFGTKGCQDGTSATTPCNIGTGVA